MPIQFKSKLSSSVANATFLDKTIDDATIGKFSLRNGLVATHIEDIQSFLNTLRTDVDDHEVRITQNETDIADHEGRITVNEGDISNHEGRITVNEGDIVSINNTLAAGEYIIKEYADDAAYELENGAPPYTSKTGIYYNTSSGLLRYYDAVKADWQDVGKTAIGEHEFLGTGNGVLTDFDVSFLPLTEDSFIVYKNGTLVPRSEYTFSNPTISFTSAPAAASRIDVWILTEGTPALSITPAGTQEVGYYTMTSTEITNKQLTLPSTPASATKVMVDIIGGSAQQYGIDFSVSGTTLDWNGLGLESELSIGSVIRYFYFS